MFSNLPQNPEDASPSTGTCFTKYAPNIKSYIPCLNSLARENWKFTIHIIKKIAPKTVHIIGVEPAALSPNFWKFIIMAIKPNSENIPAEFDNMPCNGFDLTPALFTYLIRETKCPRDLPVFSGSMITFINIITNDTASKIVVITPVSDIIMKIAAINTPKFQAKLTTQLIVRSSVLAKSKPSGNPTGLGAFAFFSFF